MVFTSAVALNPATGVFIPPILRNDIASVNGSGANRVTITLKHPLPESLFLQAASYVPIVPKHILGKVPPSKISTDTMFSRHPIGTEPLKLVKWVQGNYLEFQTNRHYFLGPPQIHSAVVEIVPSPMTAIAQLESGKVDLMDYTNPITRSEYFAAIKHADVKGYVNQTLSWKNTALVELRMVQGYLCSTSTGLCHTEEDAYSEHPGRIWRAILLFPTDSFAAGNHVRHPDVPV